MNTSERYIFLRGTRINFCGKIDELLRCLFFVKKKKEIYEDTIKFKKVNIIKYKRRCFVETASILI